MYICQTEYFYCSDVGDVAALLVVAAEKRECERQNRPILNEMAFIAAVAIALLPTLITRKIIYGGFFKVGAYSAAAMGL